MPFSVCLQCVISFAREYAALVQRPREPLAERVDGHAVHAVEGAEGKHGAAVRKAALKALELRPLRGDLEAQLGAFELPADDLCIAGGGAAQGGVLRLRVEGGDGAVYAAGLELDRARLGLDDALAERALLPVIPSVDEFPYAIRVVSEVVSSNGSTSQGSICGSTLALMDAGVPIKAPVAGISCGLIQDGDDFTTFIDIQGVEDFHGEMDFKVAGTKKGITAIQMDLKNDGLTMAIIKNALEITYDARVQILDQIMLPCISEPRAEVSQYAPKMITMHIDPERIREVIGKGGSVIQKIVADTGAKVDIDDDGTIHIASANAAACDAAKKCIDDIVFVPEVGKLYYGRVVRLMQFGAFVEIAPGKDGLVHISKLDRKRVEKVEDVVTVGDMIWVKFMEIDEKGRWNLSRKDALIEIEAQQAAAKAAEQQ